MKLSIARGDLLRGLTTASGVANRKTSMPILSCVLLTADNDALRVRATDLSIGVSGYVDAKVEDPGAIAVEAKQLIDIARNLSDDEIHIEAKEDQLTIQCGRSNFELAGMAGGEFPAFQQADEDAPSVKIMAADLRQLITSTQYAISMDIIRPVTCGMYLKCVDNRMITAAMTGLRLAKAECDAEGTGLEVMVPERGVDEIRRICSANPSATLSLSTSKGYLFVDADDYMVTARLLEAAFVNYERFMVVDEYDDIPISKAMLSTIKRAMIVSKDNTIRLCITKDMMAVTAGSGRNKVREEIPIEASFVSPDETEKVVYCNAQYLLDAIGGIVEDNAHMRLKGLRDPMLIMSNDGAFVGLVMLISKESADPRQKS